MNLLAEFNGKISDCIMYLRHEFSMQAVNSKFKFHASSDQVVRYLVGCFCAIIAYFNISWLDERHFGVLLCALLEVLGTCLIHSLIPTTGLL